MSTPKKRKPRSPSAPSRSLKDVLDDVKKLYTEYSHATFSRSEIASALGMSATSGPFATRLYTLRAYGLLDPDGNDFKVSDSFRELNTASPADAGFKRHALGAIRRSDVFRELLDEFTSKLPTQTAVAQRLETQKKFNQAKAQTAATALEESLRFAGLLDASNNILPIREGAPPADDTQHDEHDDEVFEDVSGNGAGGPGAMLRTEVPITDGRRVVVHYPADLTGQEAQKVGNVLKAIVD
jgi:hypothetical protein